ncbi:MAG: transcriptional antiterminator, partial [Pseudomonas sp.]|nr:transcriptional antiterminator [Pseudomonas sp.]
NSHHADTKTKTPAQRVDWDKRDREYLHALRQLTVFLQSNPQGPRRSKNYYFNLLENSATVEKNINRMPLSKSFLTAHVESVAQYQIRRLQNAHNDLLTLFDMPPRWRLLRNATLSDERLSEQARIFLNTLMSTPHEVQRFRKQ